MQPPVNRIFEFDDRVRVSDCPGLTGTVVDTTDVLVEVKLDTGGHGVYYHEHLELIP